jgi:hypothetical protein
VVIIPIILAKKRQLPTLVIPLSEDHEFHRPFVDIEPEYVGPGVGWEIAPLEKLRCGQHETPAFESNPL